MELENFIENVNLITDFFGYFPKFHDSEITSLNFEISNPGYYPAVTLSVLSKEKGKRCRIVLEFVNIADNCMEDFSNQNSVYEMNFSRQEDHINVLLTQIAD